MSDSTFIMAMAVVALCIVGVITGMIFLVIKSTKRRANQTNNIKPDISDLPLYRTYSDVFLCHIPEVCADMSDIDIGAPVEFIPENDNPHDNTAVAVYCENKKIGYLFRKNRLKDMIYRSFSDNSKKYTATISGKNDDKVTLCVNRYEDIPVYISPRGKAYHEDPVCLNDASDYDETLLSQALKKGYIACSKCSK